MAYRRDWIAYIRRNAARYGVDPRAALAVASAEGLSGAVGDQGTSFGPFQLHVGGALPSGRGRGWAESQAGLDYALRQIGGVSKGQTGRAAIEAIVRRFERPADPSSEVSRAESAYGSFGGGAPLPAASSGAAPTPGGQPEQGTSPQLQALLSRYLQNRDQRPDWYALAAAKRKSEMTSAPSPAAQAAGGSQPAMPTDGKTPHGALAEAFYDPLGSWDNGKFGGAIGHHSDHVHLSITNAQAMLAAIAHARQMGLHVGENPYIDHVDPVHVKGSYHYRDFPGKYNGRKLGEAIDVSGDAKRMAGFYRWATSNLR